jgi:NNP family nitrate/nitrite transporter-like MFS transporter
VLQEGLALTVFSRLTNLVPATVVFLVFGLFVCMACGVTYAVVPLVRPRAIGSASGIVGAGGNVGALLAGFLFKSESISSANAFFYPGISVAVTAFFVLLLRFQEAEAPGLVFAGVEALGAQSAN